MDLEPVLPLTDLKELEIQAALRWEVNSRFRNWLKHLDPLSVAQTFDQHSRKIAKKIDCQECGNCCRAHVIVPRQADSKRLAEHLSLDANQFREKYLKKDLEGDLAFKQRPCPFLSNNSCSVYEARPTTCRSYPHLEIDHMAGRGWNHLENTRICPIVFNVYEELREVYGFENGKSLERKPL